jgi:DNA-directed RNA polymerase subunit RPC12/RpoP
LGENYESIVKDGGYYPLYTCPECKRETLVDIGPSGSQFEHDQYICFACGQAWKESSMDKCMSCGRLYLVDEDDCGMCPDCIEYQMSKE